jgi:prevent-host-death family protein
VKWQVQEAKQRFSELLRRAIDEGPQSVTKHGEEVAVIMDVAYYRELTGQRTGLRDHLLHGPKSDEFADLVDSVAGSYPELEHDPVADLVAELTDPAPRNR